MFTDSHAHLGMAAFAADLPDVIGRANAAGVTRIVNVVLGPDEDSFESGLAIARTNPGVCCTIAVHPHDGSVFDAAADERVRRFAREKEVVAIGEIGLDYHYNRSTREEQLAAFRTQLDLALDLGLPITVHTREADEDTYRELSDRKILERVGGVMHCFTGTADEAKRYLDLGAHISFSGILTFKKAEALREAAGVVPLDRLMIETDCPYLAPESLRGKRNEPAFVVQVAETLARLKGLAVAEIGRITSENASRVLRFP